MMQPLQKKLDLESMNKVFNLKDIKIAGGKNGKEAIFEMLNGKGAIGQDMISETDSTTHNSSDVCSQMTLDEQHMDLSFA